MDPGRHVADSKGSDVSHVTPDAAGPCEGAALEAASHPGDGKGAHLDPVAHVTAFIVDCLLAPGLQARALRL